MRLKISYLDRVGLVLDISKTLAARKINIVSMEVELNTIYLETNTLSDGDKIWLIGQLEQIAGVTSVHEIDLMPHQEQTEQMKALLASVSDGIVAIDCRGHITQYNAAAEKILRIPASEAIGNHISDIFSNSMSLLDALYTGTIYNNREVFLEQTNSHYLVSGRPVIDQSEKIIGAVAVLKDISDVRDLVYKVTGQLTLTFNEILYTSQAMHQVVTMAKTYARGHSTILIRGETGTGKEFFARALHAASPRKDKVFVPVNCAAIPDTLLESELFGYEDGAFTGAAKGGKQGLFEFANGGTIFLDEIGELSGHLQAKLLRVLQEGKVRRIGSNREIQVNVRILAATNRNLEEMIAQQRFREDLYYRLNVIPLFLPPLRDRAEDIPILAQYFIDRFAASLQKPVKTISETALEKLKAYHWPGNIRELENAIERAVNIVEGSIILAEHIMLDHGYACKPKQPAGVHHGNFEQIMAETERKLLAEMMTQHRSARRLAAAIGLSHTAVLKKLRKHGLKFDK